MKNILTLFLLVVCNLITSQGLILDKTEFSNTRQWEPKNEQGFSSSNLPSKISYRKYTPVIQEQGQVATCVGWSVAYAQLSTQQNLLMGITDPIQKIFRSMDPYFLYGNIKNYNDQWCQKGTRIYDAMNVLMSKGTKPWVWDPWLTCNSTITFSDFTNALASNYTIDDYFAVPNDDLVKNVKDALNYKFIVSIGVKLTESFKAETTATYGIWSPLENEESIGGHAMCVVGYDDNKFGGAFEVMNSWGADYGENGFIWIKYRDFKKYVDEAYVIAVKDYKNGDCSMGDCYNSYSRFKFNDGNIYEGLIVNGFPDIFGSIVYPNGNFYVGGMNKGRKHGSGLVFDSNKGAYFNVIFNNDAYVSWDLKQGFSSEENSAKMIKLGEILNSMNPGKIMDPNSEEQETYFENLEIPEQPMKNNNLLENNIPNKTKIYKTSNGSDKKQKKTKRKKA